MPEGDTLHRLARVMQPLVGQALEVLELPRSTQPTAHLRGARIEKIEALGKNLLITLRGEVADDPAARGSTWVLHTHLRMNGRWRLRRRGPTRPRIPAGAVVYLATPTHEALCTDAPTVVLARAGSLRLDRLLTLGPDLLAEEPDLAEMVHRLLAAEGVPLGVAVMDQRLVAGIGNIWKSEGLFARGLDPFAPVERFAEAELRALLEHTRRAMLANVDGSARRRSLVPRASGRRVTRPEARSGDEGFAVYERAGQPCRTCRAPIERRRQGTRSTYSCDRCQPRRA